MHVARAPKGVRGATPNEIAAVTGHATLKEMARYTAAASNSLLADSAFEKLASSSRKVLANHPERFAQHPRKTPK
jgi:integrase/recombinase XerD